MKALLLSIRTILRFRTYTAINVLGLALSLGCVFVLVRKENREGRWARAGTGTTIPITAIRWIIRQWRRSAGL